MRDRDIWDPRCLYCINDRLFACALFRIFFKFYMLGLNSKSIMVFEKYTCQVLVEIFRPI